MPELASPPPGPPATAPARTLVDSRAGACLTVVLLWTTATWIRRRGLLACWRALAAADRFLPRRRWRDTAGPREELLPLARDLAARIERLDRRWSLCPGECLPGSLTLWFLLQRAGASPALRLGVRTVTGRFEAHAWVEVAGEVLNDSPDTPRLYAPFEHVDFERAALAAGAPR